MAFAPDLIERVRDASDVVAVVAEHVQLKRTGRAWKGLCPFHTEKTPSFTVNPDRQIFKCFGCGVGGDVFRFIMDFEKLSFPEAIELLAGRAGIPLPRRSWEGPQDESVFPVLEWASNQYRRILASPAGVSARAYLERRDVSPGTIERFGLGWAPDSWNTLLQAAGSKFSPALLERAGLVVQRENGGHYDRFRGRVIIPIRSALGRTVAFGGRIVGEGEPKYLNSPETEVFTKGRVLFGLSEARDALRQSSQALVVEGYMDAMALSEAGFPQVVAACGTAFTADQARVVRRYVEKVVLLFDGDLAGVRAAWKSAGVFLAEGLEVRVIALPDGHDPDSFVRKEGRESLAALVEGAPGVVEFARETLLDRLEKREDLLRAFAYLGAQVGDPIRRRNFLQEAAEAFRFEESVLVAEAERQRGGARSSGHAKPPGVARPTRDPLGRAYICRVITSGVGSDEDWISEEVLREEPLRDVYRRVRALWEEGERQLQGRFMADEEFRDFTAELLSGDDEGQDSLIDVVVRLKERERSEQSRRLREAIQTAETRGDRDEVERLLRELQTLRSAGS